MKIKEKLKAHASKIVLPLTVLILLKILRQHFQLLSQPLSLMPLVL